MSIKHFFLAIPGRQTTSRVTLHADEKVAIRATEWPVYSGLAAQNKGAGEVDRQTGEADSGDSLRKVVP